MTQQNTWAKTFHDTYERLAPDYGYETRKDTKVFDPNSPNGRLMTAVCEYVILLAEDKLREEIKGEIVNSKKTMLEDTDNEDTYEEGYEQCLDDVLSLPSLKTNKFEKIASFDSKGKFNVWTPEIKEHAEQVKEIIENREKLHEQKTTN